LLTKYVMYCRFVHIVVNKKIYVVHAVHSEDCRLKKFLEIIVFLSSILAPPPLQVSLVSI
jgi:hypothetical protein